MSSITLSLCALESVENQVSLCLGDLYRAIRRINRQNFEMTLLTDFEKITQNWKKCGRNFIFLANLYEEAGSTG